MTEPEFADEFREVLRPKIAVKAIYARAAERGEIDEDADLEISAPRWRGSSCTASSSTASPTDDIIVSVVDHVILPAAPPDQPAVPSPPPTERAS